jgi:hypothetical protein
VTSVRTICPTCGHAHYWSWESAFDKFGFQDGDSLVMTEKVAEALRKHGYEVRTMHWGFHNTIITDISRDGEMLIPGRTVIGYDEPREYLPEDIVDLLDSEFRKGQRIEY